MKTVIVGISGSISAYKACDIVSQLTKKNYQVHVLMTKSACQFVTPLTLQTLSKNRVYVDVFDKEEPGFVSHIELAKMADLVLIAPASANLIARLAYGMADDMLTSCLLAIDDVPVFIAPAMNEKMYEHVCVQENLKTLKSRGYIEIEPRESLLACNDWGKGALEQVDVIVAHVESVLIQ